MGYAMGNAIVSSAKGRMNEGCEDTEKIWDGGRSERIGIMIKFSSTRARSGKYYPRVKIRRFTFALNVTGR